MPHVVMECSENLRAPLLTQQLPQKVHQVLVESGLFDPASIKTRLASFADYQVGDGVFGQGAFVHVTVGILEGRPLEKREALTQDIFALLRAALPQVEQVTVDLREFTRTTYRKP